MIEFAPPIELDIIMSIAPTSIVRPHAPLLQRLTRERRRLSPLPLSGGVERDDVRTTVIGNLTQIQELAVRRGRTQCGNSHVAK